MKEDIARCDGERWHFFGVTPFGVYVKDMILPVKQNIFGTIDISSWGGWMYMLKHQWNGKNID